MGEMGEMGETIPVVGLVGYSGTGKTTFMEKLIAELKRRGQRVGVIKHTHHRVEFDQPGKDSWRHARAGAEVVALAAPGGVSLVKRFASDPEPQEVIAMFEGVNIILVEGYKKGKWPKIVLLRSNAPAPPPVPAGEVIAVVSDLPPDMPVPHFGLNDAGGVANLLEQVVLGAAQKERVD